MKLTGADIAKAKRLINDALDEVERLELKDDTMNAQAANHLIYARTALTDHVKK